jgi:hypothetical protein
MVFIIIYKIIRRLINRKNNRNSLRREDIFKSRLGNCVVFHYIVIQICFTTVSKLAWMIWNN